MVRLTCVPLAIGAVTLIATTLLVLTTRIRVCKVTCSHTVRHLADIPAEAWTWLSGKTIFFGHQSVGYDIVAGIGELAARHDFLNLKIVRTKDTNEIAGPMLAHATVGRNLDPESKTAEFKELMEGGLAEKVDIAFFKFCFVDIGKTSNPEAIFADYCKAMDSLKSRFQHVVFVHVTVPLCGPPGEARGILKAGIKRLLGRPTVLDENQVRARYNSLLCERFSGKEPLFDLALYETLGPEGLRHYSLKNGQEIPILARVYTDDGGHLNAMGRRHIAEQLVIELADLASGSQ
jgi:hypothetical protein